MRFSNIKIFTLAWTSLSGSALVLNAFGGRFRPGHWSKLLGLRSSFACTDEANSMSYFDQIALLPGGRILAALAWIGLAGVFYLLLKKVLFSKLARLINPNFSNGA